MARSAADIAPVHNAILRQDDDRSGQTFQDVTIRQLMRQCPDLPAAVSDAAFTVRVERVMSASLLEMLTTQSVPDSYQGDWPERLSRRRRALTPYLNRPLICVFVRLPGAHYTLEIDASQPLIVHWEWDIS